MNAKQETKKLEATEQKTDNSQTARYAYFQIRHFGPDNASIYVPTREINELAAQGWRYVAEFFYGANARYFLMERRDA